MSGHTTHCRKSLMIVLASSFSLVCFTACNTHPRQVSLVQEWFPNSNYAGAVLARDRFAKFHNLNINIIQGSDNVNPVALVAAGSATFGDASADAVILANDKGANLVILGVVSRTSPTVFITKKSSSITTPEDFQGHRVGILDGTNTEYIYRSLVSRYHLRRIREISVPFDIKTFIVTNQYDVRPAYIYDEPVTLDELNIEYNVIDPSQFGVHFVGTVYFTRRDLLTKDPTLVRDFIDSVADGWRGVIARPDLAVDSLVKYDANLKPDHESRSLQKTLPYIAGTDGKVLWIEPTDWTGTVDGLKSLGLLSRNFDIKQSVEMKYVAQYYSLNKP